MRLLIERPWCVALLLGTLASGSLPAQPTITFTMLGYPSGVQGPVMGGVYTSPYYATIGNSPTAVPVICDDFVDNTYFAESWTAYATALANIPAAATFPRYQSGTVPSSPSLTQNQAYTTAAYLSLEILQTDQSTAAGQQAAGDLSYAMWGLFDPAIFTQQNGTTCSLPGAEGCLSLVDYNAATTDLQNAWNYVSSHGLNTSNFVSAESLNSVTIYSYDAAGGAPTCPGGPCPSAPPQEFISISVPEPSSPAHLAIYLAALLCLVIVARRRLVLGL